MKPYQRPKRRQPSGGQLTSRRWQVLRAQVIKEEPLCRLRLSCCTMLSDTVDHIVPVSFRPDLKFFRPNLRGSCRACNQHRGNRPLSQVRAEDERREIKSSRFAAASEFFS